jgi:hypothetical protein
MPIVLGAVLVFVASSIIHMMLKWHNASYQGLPEAAADALRPFNLQPGSYFTPWSGGDMKMMQTPEFQARIKAGPNALITVRPNENMAMGPMLGKWFVYSLLVGALTAFVAGRYLPQGTNYRHVYKITALVSFMGYGLAHIQYWVWWSKSNRQLFFDLLDSVIYAAVTAGAFGALWPR